jgi:membrane protease YdiL (CAAX protease family)
VKRAYAEATLLVAIWMALGFAFRLGDNAYLLAGIPLTIAFQRTIARRPLRGAWLRDAPAARLDGRWAVVAALLAAFPAYLTWRAFVTGQRVVALWAIAALVGAGAAAYALRDRSPRLVREMLRCLAIAGSVGAAWLLLSAIAQPRGALPPLARVVVGLRSLVLYFPACFVLEEVTFRGVLDAHVAARDRRPWRSALAISALWGAWHLPIAHVGGARLAALPALLLVHVTVGVPLSFAWRRSGNLAVPAATHAAIDAVRNALLGA